MAHELNYNELVMLSALPYYEDFSDFKSINLVIGEKYDVGTFIEYALNRKYETCFNELISDEEICMLEQRKHKPKKSWSSQHGTKLVSKNT